MTAGTTPNTSTFLFMSNLAIAAVNRQIRRILAVLAVVAATEAHAQVAQPFEVALGGGSGNACNTGAPGFVFMMQWFGTHENYYSATNVVQIDSGDGVNVFALVNNAIVRITPDNTRTPFFSDPAWYVREFTVVPETGRIYAVIAPQPIIGETHLGVISPQGVLTATYPLGIAASSRVTSRGCIFYFVRDGNPAAIGRFDACSGTALPDLPTGIPRIQDIDVLPDGRFLVAGERAVTLHDASGALNRTFVTLPPSAKSPYTVQQVAASPDLSTIWYAIGGCDLDESELISIAFATADELSRRRIGLGHFNLPNSLVVGANSSHAVPTASEWALIALSAILAAAGVFPLKR